MFNVFKLLFYCNKLLGLNMFSFKILSGNKIQFSTSKWHRFTNFSVLLAIIVVHGILFSVQDNIYVFFMVIQSCLTLELVYCTNFYYTKKLVKTLNFTYNLPRPKDGNRNLEFYKFIAQKILATLLFYVILFFNNPNFLSFTSEPSIQILLQFNTIVNFAYGIFYFLIITELSNVLAYITVNLDCNPLEEKVKLARLIEANFHQTNKIFQLPLLITFYYYFFDMMLPFSTFLLTNKFIEANVSFWDIFLMSSSNLVWIVYDFYMLALVIHIIETFRKKVRS